MCLGCAYAGVCTLTTLLAASDLCGPLTVQHILTESPGGPGGPGGPRGPVMPCRDKMGSTVPPPLPPLPRLLSPLQTSPCIPQAPQTSPYLQTLGPSTQCLPAAQPPHNSQELVPAPLRPAIPWVLTQPLCHTHLPAAAGNQPLPLSPCPALPPYTHGIPFGPHGALDTRQPPVPLLAHLSRGTNEPNESCMALGGKRCQRQNPPPQSPGL